ncbi:glycosyltransferase family 1 protein [Treponema sp. Marseille-Q4130]|uniref:glycosyltransferase family 4 protein n=1 Tax=Treponema sp. Marseille-Q4130 TaxID=2766702 RepID=UPI001651D597|nr:glycosyltransferase family 1 protein [Treponema sp. Marseille-Q4130]MBC6721367.1 glycosyltransferase family 4 protein [Treponema sp. Marseille-Q4130]
MKVGVFLGNFRPEDGGASSLLLTIRNEINASDDMKGVEFVFLYSGGLKKSYNTFFDGNCYINYTKVGVIRHIISKTLQKLFQVSYKDTRLNLIAKKENIDLFWFPQPVKFDVKYPYIYTVWDLGHRRTPYFPEVSRSGWLWEDREDMYQTMLYRASFVITGNEEGKKEILENYPMPASKVRISEFPVASFCRGEEKKPDFIKEDPYFFYPAQFWPHKNHITILDALELLAEKYDTNPIVYLTGSDKGNRKYIASEIKRRGLENQVIFTGFVSDENLKYLYTHAVGMIFASLMGPNNMPPIEATYLQCPIIITDLDGHKEQLGDTALYFNGYKPEELVEHMNALLSDTSIRNAIIEKEKKLGQRFDKINYFAEIKKIIKDFSLIRRTWGNDFVI